MSVAPLVYQQPVMFRASARFGFKRGWMALRTGQGSTKAVSPIPLTCFLGQGGYRVVPGNELSVFGYGEFNACAMRQHAPL